ncbi:unnamed protein product [Notodromas monacha]|uniref:Uncharacterized protein n=1 Tax=Notodromas monacha TaxID=399045 RepID=A0A7R9BFC8_9CRUS|nr:unnamed protein product [Notodromas monacha]CAG0913161.1 unnamed protein product [Notodromas monacha]
MSYHHPSYPQPHFRSSGFLDTLDWLSKRNLARIYPFICRCKELPYYFEAPQPSSVKSLLESAATLMDALTNLSAARSVVKKLPNTVAGVSVTVTFLAVDTYKSKMATAAALLTGSRLIANFTGVPISANVSTTAIPLLGVQGAHHEMASRHKGRYELLLHAVPVGYWCLPLGGIYLIAWSLIHGMRRSALRPLALLVSPCFATPFAGSAM